MRSGCRRLLSVGLLLGFCAPLLSLPGESESNSSADLLVQRLQAANLRRDKALKSYTGRRIYKVDYQGILGSRHAEMVVEAAYDFPASKKFTIISQSGSEVLLKRVLLRLLESEKEALLETNRARTALTQQNYFFTFEDVERTPQETFYVLKVEPKVRNKFLYRGKIWIDLQDYAVARIEAEPAKNPSWWIRSTRIQHQYAKVGSFWLPVHNQSLSQVRLGGKAVLDIEYLGYQITSVSPADASPRGGGH
jgi:hypothetical protein